MKPTEFEINCIMSSINEVQQVQKAMNEYGVTDRYSLPKYYAANPPHPGSSDPLASSTIVEDGWLLRSTGRRMVQEHLRVHLQPMRGSL